MLYDDFMVNIKKLILFALTSCCIYGSKWISIDGKCEIEIYGTIIFRDMEDLKTNLQEKLKTKSKFSNPRTGEIDVFF